MTRYEITQRKDVPYHVIVKEWRYDFYSRQAYPSYEINIDYSVVGLSNADFYYEQFFDLSWHPSPSDSNAFLRWTDTVY